MKATHGIAMTARPLTDSRNASILLDQDGRMTTVELHRSKPITIEVVDAQRKYCTGWYDIATHTNHPCEVRAVVESKFESCFACRKKTDFNPAFYNAVDVSEKQQAYNKTPHTVYAAYFGNGLAKAGIMADSRGFDRLFEQGTLWYSIIARTNNAVEAHRLEERLIGRGLKNSVTKKQKEAVLLRGVDAVSEQEKFSTILHSCTDGDRQIVPLLDHFFFGSYEKIPIIPFAEDPISGYVYGVVGRYLVLENNGRYYGLHLSDVCGRTLQITDEIRRIEGAPVQAALF